jgi:hypothetical protein
MYTQPFAVYMRRLIRRLADYFGILTEEYMRGWSAGVNQHHYEPRSAEHGIITHYEYWGEE